jgi:hypothetical protein
MSFTNKNNFYITLPSNANVEQFPSNTQASYTILMPKPLEFVDNWEVGLAEIHYPKQWRNILKNDTFKLHFVSNFITALKRIRLKTNIELNRGGKNSLPDDIHILNLKFNSGDIINRDIFFKNID